MTTARERSYAQAWDSLVSWAQSNRRDMASVEALDVAVTVRLSEMFFDGHDLADGTTLLAAVKFFRQDAKEQKLTRASDALAGFRKLDPMLCVIVFGAGHTEVAWWLLLIWATCSRPGECHRLLMKHLVRPSRLCKSWVVVLNSPSPGTDQDPSLLSEPRERLPEFKRGGKPGPSKVGETDEAVIIDRPYLQGLLPRICAGNASKRPEENVFSFDMSDASRLFVSVVNELGYNKVGINCVYQVRHGSASTDVLQGFRTLEQVQKRGRWQSFKSVRRYSNGGRLSQVYGQLSAAQRSQAEIVERGFKRLSVLPALASDS